MNIILLIGVAVVFWHLFGRKGDAVAAATPAQPLQNPPTDESTVASSTGDVTTGSTTP
jgi:hypothetical protein